MSVAYKHKLSNGRDIKALEGKFTQAQVFKLHKNGLFVPATEGIATVRQLDDALNTSKVYTLILNIWSRAREFAFYPRGFETDLTKALGKKLVWMEKERDFNQKETGRILAVIINVPDVPVKLSNGTEISLQKAVGMGIIPIDKLELKTIVDNNQLIMYEVSVASDFNPATDLKVKDAARPRVWSNSVDEDGFALNDGRVSDQVGWDTPSARFSSVRHSNEFLLIEQLPTELQEVFRKMNIKPEEIGFGASVACDFDGYFIGNRRGVCAVDGWSYGSAVALVSGREATAPVETSALAKYKITEHPGKLIVEGTPEQLEEAKRKLME